MGNAPDRTAQVFFQLFAIQHEVEWITWHALHHPETVDGAMVQAYESAVHAAYPKALGAMALVAAMDQELYKDLKADLDDVYSLDGAVANAALSVPSPGAVQTLSELNVPARTVYEILPIKMAKAMQTAEVRARRARDN